MKNVDLNHLEMLIKNKLRNIPFKKNAWNIGNRAGALVSEGINKFVAMLMR
jgi:hypothetical protein